MMLTTINYKDLCELGACYKGLKKFVDYHGKDSNVKFSECFDSNSFDDVFWLLDKLEENGALNKQQLEDMIELSCELVLEHVEKLKPYYSEEVYNRFVKALENPHEATVEECEQLELLSGGLLSNNSANKVRLAFNWTTECCTNAFSLECVCGYLDFNVQSRLDNQAGLVFVDRIKEMFIKWENQGHE